MLPTDHLHGTLWINGAPTLRFRTASATTLPQFRIGGYHDNDITVSAASVLFNVDGCEFTCREDDLVIRRDGHGRLLWVELKSHGRDVVIEFDVPLGMGES